jgi:hypothetical protein
MQPADQLAALLVKEEAALRRGDAEAVFLFADQKIELMGALKEHPPSEIQLHQLIQKNRSNGLLARSGLALLNQVLGASSSYGQEGVSRAGQILRESA